MFQILRYSDASVAGTKEEFQCFVFWQGEPFYANAKTKTRIHTTQRNIIPRFMQLQGPSVLIAINF